MNQPRPHPVGNIVTCFVIGICVGFAVLHPISMLIDVKYNGIHHSLGEFLQLWVSRPHRLMSLYFTILGGAMGILQGVLARKLLERSRRVRALEGLLPICANCKRIRETDERGGETWVNVEQFISKRTAADFTHSICSDCMSLLYPEYAEKKKDPGV
jgi:hypothetical protein